MEINLSKNTWTLSDLNTLEFDLLRSVPIAADHSACEAAKNRLFPPPIRDPDPDESEFVEEWKTYVTEDLVGQFSEDLTAFTNDLENAVITGADEDSDPVRSLEIPLTHAPQWFSSLNQARIVLSEVHDVFDEDGRISPREDEDFADFHRRWRIYVQSNFYASIQEWLVSRVLSEL